MDTKLLFERNRTGLLCVFSNQSRHPRRHEDFPSTEQEQNRIYEFISGGKTCQDHLESYRQQMNCLNHSCSAPLLLCGVPSVSDNRSSIVRVLDDSVCMKEFSPCGRPDSLAESDLVSFDNIGHHFAIQCLIWCLAAMAVLGNIGVICHGLPKLLKQFNLMTQSQKVHHWLVLNLAVSDMLMGIYLTVFGIVHKHHNNNFDEEERHAWLSTKTCITMGILSFSSSQISVTILVIITSFRLNSVLRPFKHHKNHFKLAVAYALISWLVWINYAVVPVLNYDAVRTVFYNFMEIESVGCFSQLDMHYDYLHRVSTSISDFIEKQCGTELPDPLPTKPSWNAMISLGKYLNIFPSEVEPSYYGYYNEQSVCTAKYFIHIETRSMPFTLFILAFNMASFIYIAMAYSVIWRRTRRTPSLGVRFFCSVDCRREAPSDGRAVNIMQHQRDKEDQTMQRRVIFIIATDFICWVPLCILSFYVVVKTLFEEEHACAYHHYASQWQGIFSIFTILVIPINSALNPFIYSARYWKIIRTKFFNLFHC